MQTTPGLYHGIPAEDYFSVNALSASGAKQLLRSPAHFLADRLSARKSTPAMQLGTLVHALVLEPKTIVDNVAVAPKFDRRTTIGKKAAEEFEASAGDKMVVDEDTFARAQRVAESVLANPVIHREMTGGAAEVTGMWNQHGAPCKSRMDYLAGATIFDVKTCRDASPDGFARQIASFSYHLQAAHYSAGYREIVGWDLDRFMFIAVETEAPYMCRLYTLDPRSLQTGRLMMERAAIAWHDAQAMVERGETALAVEDVVELAVPNWAQLEPYEA
jgi:exodeoxyribonuclease VIII